MSLLTLEPAGLQTLATRCYGWSGDVALKGAPTAPGATFQATAAAANAAHISTGIAATQLQGRLSAHGGRLDIVATEFTAQDAEDAESLAQGSQKAVTDALLGTLAQGKSAEAGSAGLPGSLLPDKTDWILGGAGATAQQFTDKVAELTRKGLAESGAEASSTLKKAVAEIKNPFNFLGKEAAALGSKMGGGVGAVMSIPSMIRDVSEGNMSAAQAITREGASLVLGTAAGAAVTAVPVVGPALAIPTSIVVGGWAAEAVDFAWQPLQEFGKAAADGGYKVARLGRL